MGLRSICAASLLLVAGACAAQSGKAALDPRLIGPDAFTRLDLLPLIRDGVETRQFCSYDRAGDNYDWQYFPLYVEPNGECVIFDAMGPGCLYRHHMNLWHGGHFGPQGFVSEPLEKDLRIRYYFDDEKTARIDMDISTFFSAKNPLGIFQSPLAYDGGDRFRVLYHPMFFRKRLKVALSRLPGGQIESPVPWMGRYDAIPKTRYAWYSYTYQVYREDPGIPTWTAKAAARMMPALISAWKNPDARLAQAKVSTTSVVKATLEPKASKMLWRLDSSGTISSLKVSLDPGLNAEAAFGTWLKITFDGAAQPQVYAPLGCLFGGYRTGVGSTFASLLLGYSPTQSYCFMPMPFWKSAVVEMVNRSPVAVSLEAGIDHGALDLKTYPQDRTGYLHAEYNREDPRTEGKDYTYLEAEGAGHIVGHVASRWGTSMEEDERTYFDGSRTPFIHGDGFEDDQGMGWGLQDLVLPVFGAFAANGGEGALYRWFVPDLYCFSNGVKHGHETYGPHSPRGHEGMYGVGTEESVTFYYSRPEPQLTLTDEIDVGSAKSETSHHYRAVGDVKRTQGKYWYDGEFNNVLMPVPAIDDDGVSFTGSSEFTAKIGPHNHGIRIRRRTDKENNRQRARVYIDGHLVTERPWYSVDFEETYRNIRWFDADFEVPAQYTRGKSSVKVRIQFESSEEGHWDEYRYWIYTAAGL